jgi:hypothetical protein
MVATRRTIFDAIVMVTPSYLDNPACTGGGIDLTHEEDPLERELPRHETSEGERWNSASTGNTSPAKSQ